MNVLTKTIIVARHSEKRLHPKGNRNHPIDTHIFGRSLIAFGAGVLSVHYCASISHGELFHRAYMIRECRYVRHDQFLLLIINGMKINV